MVTGDSNQEIKVRIGPVSYTHLDVYKRQALTQATSAALDEGVDNVLGCSIGLSLQYHIQVWFNIII